MGTVSEQRSTTFDGKLSQADVALRLEGSFAFTSGNSFGDEYVMDSGEFAEDVELVAIDCQFQNMHNTQPSGTGGPLTAGKSLLSTRDSFHQPEVPGAYCWSQWELHSSGGSSENFYFERFQFDPREDSFRVDTSPSAGQTISAVGRIENAPPISGLAEVLAVLYGSTSGGSI